MALKSPALSAELKLLLTCCQPSPINLPNQGSFNEDLFFLLVRKHRLIPQVYEAFSPHRNQFPELWKKLERLHEKATRKMLILSSELLKIHAVLTENDIPYLAFKGPALAQQVYASLNSRFCRDIDILIAPESIEQVERLLRQEGFESTHPDFELSPRQKKSFVNHYDQMVFVKRKPYRQIELHWRLFQNPHYMAVPSAELIQGKRSVEISGQDIPVMSDENMLIYLVAHGAKHKWEKLYWLLDFVAFVHNHSLDWKIISTKTKALNLELPLFQALLLSNQLLGMEIPGKLESEISEQPKAKHLYRLALEAIISQAGNQKNGKAKSHWLINQYKFNLKNSWRYKLSFLKPISVYDFKLLPLPDLLFFLYFALRPFLWSWRYLFSK